ncbi:hypothetical protein [Rathayibacter sp. VKM Ac-2805]|uniref:hypothetical protein n=1 Tax=Rathayibacter sp. VKM Ac-2805 TaxID=2609258 RepID=UPI0013201BE9|nr:hypothetical protein [Rathayibacter sp. VKM Ac-2805]QHC73768.1 hypothetical protein GSU40_08825 [Rathayibacter sp. VKM Ac-2805]
MDDTERLIEDITRKTYELESLGDRLTSEARELRRAADQVRATIVRITGDDEPLDYSSGLQEVFDAMTNGVEREIQHQVDLLRDLANSIQR